MEKKNTEVNNNVEEFEEVEQSETDEDFEGKGTKRTKKIDVTGPVSLTADRLGLSSRQRAMFSAAVAKYIGVDVAERNISVTTAFRKGQDGRKAKSDSIREDFVKPDKVALHWDGKTVSKG